MAELENWPRAEVTDEVVETTEHTSKREALDAALAAAVKGGAKTRLGVKLAPSVDELDRHEESLRPKRPNRRGAGNQRVRRKVPEHVRNADKYTKYDLSDVELSDTGQNKAAALSFLADIRKRKRGDEKPFDETTDGKIVFKKPCKVREPKAAAKETASRVELDHLESDWRRELELEAEAKLNPAVFATPTVPDDSIRKPSKKKRNIRQRRESDD